LAGVVCARTTAPVNASAKATLKAIREYDFECKMSSLADE
jgi:hypothetical protein